MASLPQLVCVGIAVELRLAHNAEGLEGQPIEQLMAGEQNYCCCWSHPPDLCFRGLTYDVIVRGYDVLEEAGCLSPLVVHDILLQCREFGGDASPGFQLLPLEGGLHSNDQRYGSKLQPNLYERRT